MLDFEIIANRLLALLNIKNKAQLADLMNVSTATMGNWKIRNKIPFEEILTICVKYKLDMKFVLIGEPTSQEEINNTLINSNNNIIVNGNNNNISNHDNENKLIDKITKLPQKRQDYYYHIISAELLELDN